MNKRALDKSLDFMSGWLSFLYEREEIPGFVIAVSHKGKVLFNEAYGYANIEEKTKLTPRHIFRIASHSKTFTATAIMQLQEQGKLNIDEPVVKYITWLNRHKDKRFQGVTIRQVMSHGAGIIRDGAEYDFWQLKQPFPNAELLKKELLETDLVIDNNKKLKYSNYGYSLLGFLIAEVSGKSYNQYVTDNIIKPLGLKDTGPEYTKSLKGRVATGYTRPDIEGKVRLPIANIDTRAMSPATGFYSTSNDICKYFTARMVGSGKLLSDKSKRQMQRIHWRAENVGDKKEEYALGLEIEHTKKRRLFGHSGGFPGYITKSFFDPKDELVVTVLTNASATYATYMAKSVVNLVDFFQDNWRPPKNGLERYEGRLMCSWFIGDIIASGDKLIMGYSDSWSVFDNPDELVRVGDSKFKIAKTSSFGSEGELVKFVLDRDGKINSMRYADVECLPVNEYIAQMSKQKVVGEEFEPS
ncbi:MAG TPA: serine hydrolase domain-containing protein [Candidatus Saccharimonadales bacterium]|nr:serine hydrolase domain-containing protein [Candidatus Saccharimonadales bacterium]